MAQWTRYQAKWNKEKPGEATLAVERDGIIFTARVKPHDLVPRGMVEALCDVTAMAVAGWVKKGKLVIAGRKHGRALYKVGDVYPIAKARNVIE
jgi:hypothetical protein